ncbi:MAG: response regulator [Deltaproteobacteria bacterium]|nr:response regulator [Deltaproteobacteria bacterium]
MNESGKTLVILLVDDDPSIVKVVGARLRSEGYKVVTAADGEAAVERARSLLPDLIILDVNLPKRIGYSVSRMLKLDGRTRRIPILMLTARDQEADWRLGALTGADGYMTKPFETQDLLRTIRNLLAAAGRTPSDP